jgi:hypothetical protein
MIQKLPGITRLTVVDRNGRSYERWNVDVSLDVQDNGRTLKFFLDDKPEPQVIKKGRRRVS